MKKYNLLVPLAGKGKRMLDGGHKLPKPMLIAGDKSILEWGMGSIDTRDCNLIFVVRREHVLTYSIDSFLKRKYGDDINLVVVDGETEGSADSCLRAKSYINNDIPLIIFCPDVSFTPVFKPEDKHFKHGGSLLTFKANSTNYSYVQIDKDGFVSQTAEKIVISENASVGVYCFETGSFFIDLVTAAMQNKYKEANEYFIAPLYNLFSAVGRKATTQSVDDMYIMGTPEELDFFKNIVLNYLCPRSFILCSDHSGFDMKEDIRKALEGRGDQYIDCGCFSSKDCDYVEFIDTAVDVRKQHPGSLIIASCRSGQGVNITANKYKDIRSVLVSNVEAAKLGIKHNAANFFAVPGGTFPKLDIDKLIDTLLLTQFEGGRHQNRISKLMKI